MKGWVFVVCAFALAGAASPATALARCIVGQQVSDPRDNIGVIVWGSGDFCRVRYVDGQSYGWPSGDLHAAEPPAKSDTDPDLQIATNEGSPRPVSRAAIDMRSNNNGAAVLRPSASSLVYHADSQGHFLVTAAINGASVRVLLDTGASLVFLTPADARAAGFDRNDLVFDRVVQTANGRVRAASVALREIRIEQVAIDNVPAAVMENLGQSVLGMSFLNRLKGFDIRQGALTISR
jgi:aspartyl protease family protein